MEENCVLRLLPLLESHDVGQSYEACVLAGVMISTLASKPRCAEPLLRQRVVSFCALLHRKHPDQHGIAQICSTILMKLSVYQQIQANLAETQAVHVISNICSSAVASNDAHIRMCGTVLIRNLTLSVTEHLSVFYDDFDPTNEDLTEGEEGWQSAQAITESSSPDEPKVGRIAERHLLHGVKFLQQEIARTVPKIDGHNGLSDCNIRSLQEACTAIANLSTIKPFRAAMVRLQIIPSLLRVFELTQHAPTIRVPPILRSICSATLHILATEEDAVVHNQTLLVPSLLDILRQTDEELHQVRYECEKVSMPPALTSTREDISDDGSSSSLPDVASMLRSPRPLVATTACIKQTYRDPRWTIYLVKTMVSSSIMVPQLEKKQIRPIGLPRLSPVDVDPDASATDAQVSDAQSRSDDDTRTARYLLQAPMLKFTEFLSDCGGGDATDAARRTWSVSDSAPHPSTVGATAAGLLRSGSDMESIHHSRKFDRHMRLTRRNHRRTNVLPAITLI
ncbi:hypothetical protein PINS_up006302 [Pythium insidiosum]|nr:hypothetical protein PINS_up006302 [Pythium insidiosum]